MSSVASPADMASLTGDPERAAITVALMDGRALTANELAQAAGVTPQTASRHLAWMSDSGLVSLERFGPHRYFRFATPSVAGLIEAMMSISDELGAAASRRNPVRTGPREPALRRARLCHGHLGGEVAVGIATSMMKRGQLRFGVDGGSIMEEGVRFLDSLGLHIPGSKPARSRLETYCRPCLDWSERRPHLAGTVGRALYEGLVRTGWVCAPTGGRAVQVTPLGLSGLARHFYVTLAQPDGSERRRQRTG
jgi:DNA-binding transcriptional ArsR family regulator